MLYISRELSGYYVQLCALYVVSLASLLCSVETIALSHVVNPDKLTVCIMSSCT